MTGSPKYRASHWSDHRGVSGQHGLHIHLELWPHPAGGSVQPHGAGGWRHYVLLAPLAGCHVPLQRRQCVRAQVGRQTAYVFACPSINEDIYTIDIIYIWLNEINSFLFGLSERLSIICILIHSCRVQGGKVSPIWWIYASPDPGNVSVVEGGRGRFILMILFAIFGIVFGYAVCVCVCAKHVYLC
jgi:hypothetical protein